MTEQEKIQELLKPRYKVVAPFWDSPFKVDQVITMTGRSKRFPIFGDNNTEDWETWIDRKDGGATGYSISKFRDYPNLFKELEWWQDREFDLTGVYVRFGDLDKKHSCFQLKERIDYPHMELWHMTGIGDFDYQYPIHQSIPITSTEYQNYLKLKM